VRQDTEQQSQSAQSTHRDPVVRGANAIDRYSLALQLIQVYPIILGGVAALLPVRWLRILVAIVGLLLWTTLAVVRERTAESRKAARPRPDRDDEQDQSHDDENADHDHEIAVLETALERTSTATATTPITHEVRGIRVDIWLHSADSGATAPPDSRGRRTYRRPNQGLPPGHRPSAVPKPRAHPQSTDNQPSRPDSPPGRPSASPDSAGLSSCAVRQQRENRWATKP
jgi:hypothetical protein